ncbi:MAG TPA: nitrate- and nitrite sensing domain-containing protein [Streptosporangiaceae bacterium]|nr:nitrate- and nitrite sensing domain-containing protein [Streptosporangiaceae bacterium]
MRSRLLLLITIPTLTAVVLGGTRIVTSVQEALTFQRIETLANLSSAVTTLAGKMEDERDRTVVYIADNGNATTGTAGRAAYLAGGKAKAAAKPQLQLVQQQWAFTAPWIKQVRDQLSQIGSTYPDQVQQDAGSIRAILDGLPDLRSAATTTQLPALSVVSRYTSTIDSLLAIDDDIALDTGDPALASTVRALGFVSRIGQEASEQRAFLADAFTQERYGPGVLAAATSAQAEENDNFTEFTDSATPAQVSLYNNTVSGSLVDLASQYEQNALQQHSRLPQSPVTADEWFGAQSGNISAIRKVEQQLVAEAVSRSGDLRRNAIIDAVAIGAAVVIVLGLALILTTLVGRSMVRPLRRLRAGALEVAGLQLPETVRRMSESDGASVPLTIEPIDVDSTDEIGEVARAFDQVHREALRLAANEAALRGNVNAMFVNLSRRSQSLVERQIRLIDDLEQGEQDAERLGSLFQMDHLATRMRRNSENLLVLAGHDSSRRWNQPVALVDVLRAAVSEIEQYERVSLNVQPGISVRGHAVNDVVHLLAELAENATSFSSAETPVTISGHLLSSGGVLLDITDQGVGMGAEEMAHANWRLDNPPVVDVAVSRRMGLFVVARLAARHGVRVRLRPAASGGLTALVWLPDEVISREGASPSGSRMPDTPAEVINFSGPSVRGLDDRASTAQEVDAARAPKFASLQGENGSLGPRRVPGAGPHPGAVGAREQAGGGTTGPMPAFPTSPQPADADEPAAAPQPQAASADGWDTSNFDTSGFDAFDTASFERPSFDAPPAGASGASGAGWGQPPATQGTGSRPAAARTPDADAEAASSDGSSPGNGRQLPKRRVDRSEPGAAGSAGGGGMSDLWAASGTTDMFTRPAGGSVTGSGPEDDGPAAGPQPPEPAGAGAGGGTGSRPVFGAPVTSEPKNGTRGTNGHPANGFSWEPGSPATSGDEVVVPPAEHVTEYRLPIFEAVESDWFRRGRNSGWAEGESPEQQPAQSGWSSPADAGWQAAAAVSTPTSSGTTTAGLPKRTPRANLVPGAVGAEEPAPAPARSAAATRDRFASFQRGIREGRAAATSGESQAGEGDGSR